MLSPVLLHHNYLQRLSYENNTVCVYTRFLGSSQYKPQSFVDTLYFSPGVKNPLPSVNGIENHLPVKSKPKEIITALAGIFSL